MKHLLILLLIVGFNLGLVLTANAHPGRTDASGCHTCRTNCSDWGLYIGEYHCHNATALPQPEPPVTSTYGENGTGYTEYEPAYEKSDPEVVDPEPAVLVEESPTTYESDSGGDEVEGIANDSDVALFDQATVNVEDDSNEVEIEEAEVEVQTASAGMVVGNDEAVLEPGEASEGDALAGFIILAIMGGGTFWVVRKVFRWGRRVVGKVR